MVLVLLFGPLYGAGRIMLPDWLKGQMASALPEGSQLSIGEMFSTAKMGVQYKDIFSPNEVQYTCGSVPV